jgi:hypothetical protein
LNNSLRSWFGQVTTGHGFMLIAATILSVLAGTTSWVVASPLLVAGVIGLLWPENAALRTAAQATAADVEAIVAAYNAGKPSPTTAADVAAMVAAWDIRKPAPSPKT